MANGGGAAPCGDAEACGDVEVVVAWWRAGVVVAWWRAGVVVAWWRAAMPAWPRRRPAVQRELGRKGIEVPGLLDLEMQLGI